MANSNLVDVMLVMVVAVIVLFVGIQATSAIIATDDGGGQGTVQEQTGVTLNGTQYVTLSDTQGTNETVYDSRGYAVELQGQPNSYIKSSSDIRVANDTTWTVSAWASRQTNADMTALDIDGQLLLGYNATNDVWDMYYYNRENRDSYRLNTTATSARGELENVVVQRDGSTLTIYTNASNANSISLSGGTAPTLNYSAWDGRLEEVRLADDVWNTTERSEHYTNPIDPIPQNATGRMMFDEPYRDAQRFFYASGDVETSNVDFVDGLDGQELTRDGVVATGDYEWDSDGPRLRPVQGGEIEAAPVAYVDYDRPSGGLVSLLVSDWITTLQLAGILLILLPVGAVILYLSTVRGGR